MGKKQNHHPGEILSLLAEGGKGLDLSELARHILDAFGGVEEFAKEYVQEAKNAHGVAKTKMLEGVLRIVSNAGAKRPGKPPSEMTEAELEEALVTVLLKRGAIREGDVAVPPGPTS